MFIALEVWWYKKVNIVLVLITFKTLKEIQIRFSMVSISGDLKIKIINNFVIQLTIDKRTCDSFLLIKLYNY